MLTKDGYEAAAQIRAKPWGREIRLVALVAWGNGSAGDYLSRENLTYVSPTKGTFGAMPQLAQVLPAY